MPIKPPNLDDRRYADIVDETKKLIPQYCPEWTNFSAADPGMTLVQLFAWMTELIIYRLNKVPEKTYIHFLNFIGEERKEARPAVAPLTFSSRAPFPIEVPPLSSCSTRQTEDDPALDFLTTEALTVHNCNIERIMVVKKVKSEGCVRELPFSTTGENKAVLLLNKGNGIQIFDIDPVEYGPHSYTPNQFLYIAQNDFRLMDLEPSDDTPLGRIRVRSAQSDRLSIVTLFDWEYPTKTEWNPIKNVEEDEQNGGFVEYSLQAALPGITDYEFDFGGVRKQLSDEFLSAKWWIRGRLNYERWLVEQMRRDLRVYWKDDRGGEEREITKKSIRSSGRILEFSLQDLPPIRAGWTIGLSFVDRGYPAGRRGAYLPKYKWYYRRRENWEEIPQEQLRIQSTTISIMGPLPDMSTDGINLRAERIETVSLKQLCRDLELDLTWVRPVEVNLLAGDSQTEPIPLGIGDSPWDPFQINPMIPPTINRRLFIGTLL